MSWNTFQSYSSSTVTSLHNGMNLARQETSACSRSPLPYHYLIWQILYLCLLHLSLLERICIWKTFIIEEGDKQLPPGIFWQVIWNTNSTSSHLAHQSILYPHHGWARTHLNARMHGTQLALDFSRFAWKVAEQNMDCCVLGWEQQELPLYHTLFFFLKKPSKNPQKTNPSYIYSSSTTHWIFHVLH